LKLDAGLMKIISRLINRDCIKNGRKFSINPAFRICTALFCILLCSLSGNAVFTLIVIAGEVCLVASLESGQIVSVLKAVLPAVVFTGLIMIPAALFGSPASMINVPMKVFESVMILAVLNETSDWKDITGSLQYLHFPSLFILTLDMTIHFLVILAQFSDQMLEAVMLRTVSNVSWKDSQIGGILGTTFLKSQHIADHTSEAMVCRGFTGKYQMYEAHHLHWQDCIYLTVPCGLILLFIYTESIL